MSNFGRPAGPLSNPAHALTHVSKFRPTPAPPMSKFRTRRGPSVSNSPKKGRHLCQRRQDSMSNFGMPRGCVKVPAAAGPPCRNGRCGCQSFGTGRAPVSICQSVPGPCVNLSKCRRCVGPRMSKFPHPVGPPVSNARRGDLEVGGGPLSFFYPPPHRAHRDTFRGPK